MKVKLMCPRFGDEIAQRRGEIIEVPDEEGRRMIRGGLARPAKAIETATKAIPAGVETRGRGRPRKQTETVQ